MNALLKTHDKRERIAGKNISFLQATIDPSTVGNLQFEMALIGSVFQKPDIYPTLAEIVQAADFWKLEYGYMWYAFDQLNGRNEPIDITTVMIELDKVSALKDGYEHTALVISKCIEAATNALNAETYARAVAESALRARVIQAADDIVRAATDKGMELDAFIDLCDARWLKATNRKTERKTDMRSATNEYFDKMEKALAPGAVTCITTGFKHLDEAMPSGFTAGEVTVLAGSEGMGKTTLLLSTIRNITKRGQGVALFSLEMQQSEIMHNLMAMETGIFKSRLRNFNFASYEQRKMFIEAGAKLSELPLEIVDDYPSLTPTQLRRKLRKLIQQSKIELVVVDGLWLMEASETEKDRARDVTNITRDLVVIARDFDLPILITHQYNAGVNKSEYPTVFHLAESAGVRRNAQVILGMHRSSYYDPNDTLDPNTYVYCLKDRNGNSVGQKFDFQFNNTYSRYEGGG